MRHVLHGSDQSTRRTTMNMERKTVTLLALPTELLHRICDFLDAETIVCALRRVCVQLFATTQTYNRYKVRLDSHCEVNICQMIPPEHIVLLDVGSDGMESFYSTMKASRFTRLRSLTIRETNVNRSGTFSIASSASMAPSSLLALILNFNLVNEEICVWPRQCTITNLSIGTCTFQEWHSILQHCSRLHTLTMDNCRVIELEGALPLKPYDQLISLTLNDLQMTMDKLEHLLSLLPSLTHLDVTSVGKPFEFVQRLSRWEAFLRMRLPRLSRFECCIFCYCCDWDNFDAMITAFRTRFWLEEKRWFVTCQFRDDWTSSFTVFTSPEPSLVRPRDAYHFDRIFCSN